MNIALLIFFILIVVCVCVLLVIVGRRLQSAVRKRRELEQREELLLAELAALREKDKLKDELLTTVSHDLKSPLTSLQMAVHLLMEDGEGGKFSAKEMELLRAIAEDTERMRKMIADMLDAGRAKLAEKQKTE